MVVSAGSVPAADRRLTEAAAAGETLEVILVLRGRVRPARSAGRWRLRLQDGRSVTFAAEAVLAATPIPRPSRG